MGNLTVRAIVAAKPATARYKLTDGRGLQVRIEPSGLKSWLVRYHVNGCERQYCLPRPFGVKTDAGHLSLEDARRLASEIKALGKQGIDYQQRLEDERQAEADTRAKREQRLTVRKLFEQWKLAELAGRKDGGAETVRGLEKDVLSNIGERAAADVKRADLMAILDGVKARGAARLANRILAELRQMFGFALVREIVTADPTAGIEKRHVGGREDTRERTLPESEIRALPGVLAASGLQQSTRHVVWLLLATGARVGELAKARRCDIDLDKGEWRIPAEHSKNSDAHVVYLSGFATDHMRVLLDASDSDEWLLPARKRDGSETHANPKGLAKQIGDRQLKFYERKAHSKRTKLENALVLGDEKWTLHDLRRTAATMMQGLGVLPVVVEKCLNHREENRIKRTYQTYGYEPEMRHAWRLLGERLVLLTRTDADNVVVLATRQS
ncbi:integrase [Paraburkholderia sp. GAS448]|uniref:tyrosine-type recombinase/integrase n=1 Tax=Paraburkholderia sp. GAS448 TaxID=3035136 RepID=UPI003D1AB7F7